MQQATFTRPPMRLPVTRLRVGRVTLLLVGAFLTLAGGTVWLLRTQAHPFVPPTVDSTAWPAWMRQA